MSGVTRITGSFDTGSTLNWGQRLIDGHNTDFFASLDDMDTELEAEFAGMDIQELSVKELGKLALAGEI